MKKLFLFLLLPLLVGCGSSKVSEPTPIKSAIKNINIPAACQDSKVLVALKNEIPEAVFIDTKWTPAPNTELADFLNNGGIACSFGVASAEIGVTVRWVLDKSNNFEKWRKNWIESGYVESNLSEYSLPKGYLLIKPQSETQEFSIWSLNFKSGGVWVSINRTFGENLDAGKDIINAVLSQ